MAGRKEMIEEIETATRRLEEVAKRKEKEADERLDELLAKRKMEFCPRCSRKIRSRSEWAGKCLHDGCSELLCRDCWASEEKRYCAKHVKDYAGKVEESDDDVKILTLNYMDFIEDRVKKFGLDWSPAGFMRKTKVKARKKKYGDFELVVFEKRTLSKKPRVRILIRPMTASFEQETNEVLENLQDDGVYTILAIVGNSSFITKKAERFAGEFSNRKISLFIMNMENGDIHFNPKEKITGKYSLWANPTKMPVKFADILKGISESVSGRKIVSVKGFGEEMGMGKEESEKILRSSGLLEEVAGADTFIIKE